MMITDHLPRAIELAAEERAIRTGTTTDEAREHITTAFLWCADHTQAHPEWDAHFSAAWPALETAGRLAGLPAEQPTH